MLCLSSLLDPRRLPLLLRHDYLLIISVSKWLVPVWTWECEINVKDKVQQELCSLSVLRPVVLLRRHQLNYLAINWASKRDFKSNERCAPLLCYFHWRFKPSSVSVELTFNAVPNASAERPPSLLPIGSITNRKWFLDVFHSFVACFFFTKKIEFGDWWICLQCFTQCNSSFISYFGVWRQWISKNDLYVSTSTQFLCVNPPDSVKWVLCWLSVLLRVLVQIFLHSLFLFWGNEWKAKVFEVLSFFIGLTPIVIPNDV